MKARDIDHAALNAGGYCRVGWTKCFCKDGWPPQYQCPRCREEDNDKRESYCVCTPQEN